MMATTACEARDEAILLDDVYYGVEKSIYFQRIWLSPRGGVITKEPDLVDQLKRALSPAALKNAAASATGPSLRAIGVGYSPQWPKNRTRCFVGVASIFIVWSSCLYMMRFANGHAPLRRSA